MPSYGRNAYGSRLAISSGGMMRPSTSRNNRRRYRGNFPQRVLGIRGYKAVKAAAKQLMPRAERKHHYHTIAFSGVITTHRTLSTGATHLAPVVQGNAVNERVGNIINPTSLLVNLQIFRGPGVIASMPASLRLFII